MENDEEMILYLECEIKNIYECLQIMSREIEKYRKGGQHGKTK